MEPVTGGFDSKSTEGQQVIFVSSVWLSEAYKKFKSLLEEARQHGWLPVEVAQLTARGSDWAWYQTVTPVSTPLVVELNDYAGTPVDTKSNADTMRLKVKPPPAITTGIASTAVAIATTTESRVAPNGKSYQLVSPDDCY